MSKYIDAELLRKEIEFAKSVYDNPKRVVNGVADAFRQDGRAAMCDDILKKIDSLQQKQPSEDLNDEIKKFIEEYGYERGEDKLLIAIVARHFWNKGYNARKEEANE